MTIQNLFGVDTIFFTVLSYPMSYIEFFGTVFTGWSVYLSAKNKVLSWPIGLLGVILYGFLFYQIQLYSDLFEQIYYLLTGFWGWWVWTHPVAKESDVNKELVVSRASRSFNLIGLASIAVLTLALTRFMSNIHLIFPLLFPVAASFPFMDAFTTAASFIANVYLVKRKVENWYLWIIVDIIGVFLYYQKGVIFLALLYVFFLVNAFKGVCDWSKILKGYDQKV